MINKMFSTVSYLTRLRVMRGENTMLWNVAMGFKFCLMLFTINKIHHEHVQSEINIV